MTPPKRKRGKSKALLGKANLRGKLDAILEWYELQVTGTIGRSLAKIQWKNIRYYDYDTQWAYYKHNHKKTTDHFLKIMILLITNVFMNMILYFDIITDISPSPLMTKIMFVIYVTHGTS